MIQNATGAPLTHSLTTRDAPTMADVAEVKDAFESQGYALDSKVIADEAFALCRQYNLDAFGLAIHWDQYSVENAGKLDKKALMPDVSTIDGFKLHVERKVNEKRKSSSMRTPARTFSYDRPNLMESLEKNPRALEESGAFASITPGRGGTTPGAKTSAAKAAYGAQADSPMMTAVPEVDARVALEAHAAAPGASAYAKRAGSRSTKTELGAALATHAQAPGTKRAPVAVQVIDAVTDLPALSRDVRFMRDRIGDKVDMLERRLADFQKEVEAAVPGVDASGAVYAASQDDVTVVGRVVCDSEGRLNEASVQLEGSMATSNGMRVRLELRDVSAFSLFPGQIVCVTGSNPSGHCLVAKTIVAATTPPCAKSPASAPVFGSQSLVVASGPFTCASDLSYEPFRDVLKYCEDTRPDSLVLLGPFVDAEHRVVRGDAGVDAPFEKVFEAGVKDKLAEFAERCEVAGYHPNVVLVPSVRDAVADPVFPQPPLDPELLELSGKASNSVTIVNVPNPGTFTLNGVRIHACTQDVLRHLSAAEAAREDKDTASKGPGSDRMSRLASHLPGQRCAYPLFPPAPGACVDASLSRHLSLEKTPDLLVLPSDLQPFARVVGDNIDTAAADKDDKRFVAVNPGRLAKGNIGGTLAHVYVSEGAPEPGASGVQAHSVHSRARVDIVRI